MHIITKAMKLFSLPLITLLFVNVLLYAQAPTTWVVGTQYNSGSIVGYEDNFYRAIQDVPGSVGGTPDTLTDYWVDIFSTKPTVDPEDPPTTEPDTSDSDLGNLTPPEDEDVSSKLINISTRGYVGTGDSSMIVSFIVEGTGSKTVTIRALGPVLASFGVANTLSDPYLKVTNQATDAEIVSNDNWKTATSASAVTSSGKSEGINAKESAVQLTLQPGQYSAVVTGVNGATGNALVEVYDEDTAGGSIKLANVSTRGYVGTGDSSMIVSFILEGTGSKTVTTRALGPVLASFGVANTLADPYLKVTNQATDVEIVSNDNWQTATSASAVTSSGKSEGINAKESAVQLTLQAGQYSAVVTGVSGATGNALVEVYDED